MSVARAVAGCLSRAISSGIVSNARTDRFASIASVFSQATARLAEASVGFLIHAPENVKQQFPQFKPVESHAELLKEIKNAMAG
ncbi:MAG: hypothetical protein MUF81_18675 [Verrucomicrobia bacterium]|jgi:hypothetical protein|nr:hypothetical protein [Verrucomicrobiota bacterium]